MKEKKNAFTLIELISVLVIMAIIALIVTPIVMSIIRKVKISADKRSIDAYGRSIELAIAEYLMDTGSFPTDISQLTIEYTGDEVACETTNLNADSSIYLAGCTVGGRSVEGYTYGKGGTTPTPSYTAYNVGDHVSYNGVTYYVIEDSDTTNDTVKLLKENPLTVKEINDLNIDGITVTGDDNSYGTVQYGSSTDYSTSKVKQAVDAWKNNDVKSGDIAIARLITVEDLINNLGYEYKDNGSVQYYDISEDTPNWIHSYYSYWTMDRSSDSSNLWLLVAGGKLNAFSPTSSYSVRPVIELNKSADITKLN